MSYSFSVSGKDKAEALEKITQALETTVQAQPVHSGDIAEAQATAEAFVGLLADDDTRNVAVSMSGSIWQNEQGVQQCSIRVDANFTARA
jgi:hypothetical protein